MKRRLLILVKFPIALSSHRFFVFVELKEATEMDNIGYLFDTIKEFRQRGLEVTLTTTSTEVTLITTTEVTLEVYLEVYNNINNNRGNFDNNNNNRGNLNNNNIGNFKSVSIIHMANERAEGSFSGH